MRHRCRAPGIALACAALLAMPATAAGAPACAEADFAALDKIDTHMHLYGELPIFMGRARADGFRILTINVNYADFPPLQRQREDAVALQRAYPDRIAFAATFDAAGSERPGWLAGVTRDLDAAFAQGAVAVKIWKDVGMQQRDADGHAVMIDDPRFDRLFDWLEERHMPVLGHQGEPRNAWLPVEQMTIRGDREYFAEHPRYHMASHPEWPSYEQQIAARDRMLEQHPGLTFVGVHLASLEWDVGRIADFLRRYPNASVDVAARMPHLELQSSVDRDKVRQFFLEFQDRILYGSDTARGRGESDVDLAAAAHEAWLEDWRFLCGEAELHSGEFDAHFHGLGLPPAVLRKVYGENARRLFPSAWRGASGSRP